MALASTVSLPYDQLIGAPLVAMIEAEALAAKATADFLQAVGFTKDPNAPPDSFGALRMVKFTYQKQTVNGDTVTEEIELPLISLLPIPLLQIKRATVDFSLRVAEIESSEGPAIPRREQKAILKGSFAPTRSPVTSSTTSANTNSLVDMKVSISLVQADIPTGLSKLFQVFDNAAASRPVVPPAAAPVVPGRSKP